MINDVKHYFTFLDAESFLDNWGFGENNCGKEINLVPKGIVKSCGNNLTCPENKQLMDVNGRYDVEINGRTYDTVRLLDIELYDTGTFAEQYIDKNGKTVLWRRFNKNDWHYKKYGKLLSEMLPDNEQVKINGGIYVHWYDCITDYIC
jgi:hypothetical protein